MKKKIELLFYNTLCNIIYILNVKKIKMSILISEISICEILQPFALEYKFKLEETQIPTLDGDSILSDCIYSSDDLNILTFTAKISKITGKIQFKINSSGQRYFASSPDDKIKLNDFIFHLSILADQLKHLHFMITKYLNAVPNSSSITSYYMFDTQTDNFGTIQLKNSLIIFYYKKTTKYTYSSVKKLLTNPLIKQFKKQRKWLWN
jgi:hypothetical protein